MRASGDARHVAQALPRGLRVGARRQRLLALAVISRARGLEDQRPRRGGERRRQLLAGPDRLPGRRRDADAGKERLLAQPVLADRQHRGRGEDRHAPGEPRQRLDRQVLELDRDHVDRAGEALERGGVVIGGDRRPVGDLGRRAVLLGRQDVAAIAEPGGGERGHAAELAAADHADAGAGCQSHAPSASGRSATAAV